MDTKVQMHKFEDGELVQLKYFIKKLQGTARREAWNIYQDMMNLASEKAVADLWVFIAAEMKKPHVAPKKFIKKVRRPRYPRAPKATVKRERKYPCPNCETGTLMLKPSSKDRWPICPACHKAGKGERKGEIMRLAAPSAADRAAIVGSTAGRKLMVAAIIGLGMPPAIAKSQSRRRSRADGPRRFGDRRDAGEARAWMAKQEFKLHGKKRRGERALAE